MMAGSAQRSWTPSCARYRRAVARIKPTPHGCGHVTVLLYSTTWSLRRTLTSPRMWTELGTRTIPLAEPLPPGSGSISRCAYTLSRTFCIIEPLFHVGRVLRSSIKPADFFQDGVEAERHTPGAVSQWCRRKHVRLVIQIVYHFPLRLFSPSF